MKRMNWHDNVPSSWFMAPRFIEEPLSESDILYLQDAFLTNGFHHIQVKNIAAGRSIIRTFLGSLATYHDIACLTATNSIENGVFDIGTALHAGGYVDPLGERELEEFFIEEFYFDFMWIEASRELLASSWFVDFERKLEDFKVTCHIPMIVISYQEC